MKILAIAHPNKDYINLNSIKDVILEARLQNNRIEFWETHSKNKDWNVKLKESTVQDLFNNIERSKHDIPFLKKENKNFYFCLNREQFKEQFLKLKTKENNGTD